MARRWLINTSNNTLVGTVDDDDVTAIPAGRYAVAESVIRASGAPRSTIRVGGTWVVTGSIGVYTQPAGRTTAQTRDAAAHHPLPGTSSRIGCLLPTLPWRKPDPVKYPSACVCKWTP